MKEIKFVIPEQGERILCSADELHKELLKLPAELYVDLYHKMKRRMENNGLPPITYGIADSLTACCSR